MNLQIVPGTTPSSLVGFNDAFKAIRLYKYLCQGGVQTAVLSGNHKTKSTVLIIKQTKEAPKKRNRGLSESQTHKKKKWKRMIVSKNRKKLQFPYVVQAQYEHRTAADTHLQYHCA